MDDPLFSRCSLHTHSLEKVRCPFSKKKIRLLSDSTIQNSHLGQIESYFA